MAVLFKNVRYLTPDFQVQEGFVGVQGRDIAYLGADEPPEAAAYDTVRQVAVARPGEYAHPFADDLAAGIW